MDRLLQGHDISKITIDSRNGLRFFGPVKTYHQERPLSLLISVGNESTLTPSQLTVTVINNSNQTLTDLQAMAEDLKPTVTYYPSISQNGEIFEVHPYSYVRINKTFLINKPGIVYSVISVKNDAIYAETRIQFLVGQKIPKQRESLYFTLKKNEITLSDMNSSFPKPNNQSKEIRCKFIAEYLSSRLLKLSTRLRSGIAGTGLTNNHLKFFATANFVFEIVPKTLVFQFETQKRVSILFENATQLVVNTSQYFVSPLESTLRRPDVLQTMIDVGENGDSERFFFQIELAIYEMLEAYYQNWGLCYKKFNSFSHLAYTRVRYLLAFQKLLGSTLQLNLYTNKIVQVLIMLSHDSESCDEDFQYIWWFENERIKFNTKYADSNDPVEHFKGLIGHEINYMIREYYESKYIFELAAITHLLDEIQHPEANYFFSQVSMLLPKNELSKKPVFKIEACELEDVETCKLQTSLLLAVYLQRGEFDMVQVVCSTLLDILEENFDHLDLYTLRILARFANKYYKLLYFKETYQPDGCERYENITTTTGTVCLGNYLVRVERQCYDISKL